MPVRLPASLSPRPSAGTGQRRRTARPLCSLPRVPVCPPKLPAPRVRDPLPPSSQMLGGPGSPALETALSQPASLAGRAGERWRGSQRGPLGVPALMPLVLPGWDAGAGAGRLLPAPPSWPRRIRGAGCCRDGSGASSLHPCLRLRLRLPPSPACWVPGAGTRPGSSAGALGQHRAALSWALGLLSLSLGSELPGSTPLGECWLIFIALAEKLVIAE